MDRDLEEAWVLLADCEAFVKHGIGDRRELGRRLDAFRRHETLLRVQKEIRRLRDLADGVVVALGF